MEPTVVVTDDLKKKFNVFQTITIVTITLIIVT
jgi:hypothetical protein